MRTWCKSQLLQVCKPLLHAPIKVCVEGGGGGRTEGIVLFETFWRRYRDFRFSVLISLTWPW